MVGTTSSKAFLVKRTIEVDCLAGFYFLIAFHCNFLSLLYRFQLLSVISIIIVFN